MPVHRNQNPAEKGLPVSLVREELVQRTGNKESNGDTGTRGVEMVEYKQEEMAAYQGAYS